MSSPATNRLRHLGLEWLHHVLVALLVAIAIFVIEHAGALNWLENLTLRVAAGMQSDSQTAPTIASDPEDAVVLTIPAELYESGFHQTSPLDRNKLHTLVAALASQQPRMLVLDLDLSPGVPEALGQTEFDDLLENLAKNGIRIILATPFPVVTDEMFGARFQWMSRLCKQGISFADPRLPVTQGINLRYFKGRDALGEVSFALRDTANKPVTTQPCIRVGEGENFAAFLDGRSRNEAFDVAASSRYAEQVHIDPATLRRTLANVCNLNAVNGDLQPSPSSSKSCADLRGKAVFLGGDYDASDRFSTIARTTPVPGVVIHAAAYNGARHAPGRITHVQGILFDILIGTVAGAFFHFSWARYNGAQHRLDTLGPRTSRRLAAYLSARLWLILNFVFLFGFIWLILEAAGYLLDHHWWSNPAPMVLGIFIKSLLGSRAHLLPEQASAAHHDDHHAPAWVALSDLALVGIPLLAGLIWSLSH